MRRELSRSDDFPVIRHEITMWCYSEFDDEPAGSILVKLDRQKFVPILTMPSEMRK